MLKLLGSALSVVLFFFYLIVKVGAIVDIANGNGPNQAMMEQNGPEQTGSVNSNPFAE